jgi:hypothetical protein
MAQAAGVSPLSFSPAGSALGLGAAGTASATEDEQARKKRLASIAAARTNIAGSLSAAGGSLFNMGSL